MPTSSVADKQKRIIPLFTYATSKTKDKFGMRVQREPKLQGLGILGRGQLFSCFHQAHLEEAIKLAEVFILAKTFSEFLDLAYQARDYVNEGLYVFSLSVAVLHRDDCRGVSLPPIQEVFPDKFVPVETMYNAYKQATITDPEKEIIVESETTGNVLDPEYNVAYYREDVGINAHHWHWHIVYPSAWNAEVTGKTKDRKGELFYYMHQQMCARYDCERLSNDLPRMVPFHNFHEPLEGYSAHLSSIINGLPYSSRSKGLALHDMHDISVQELERFRERISGAINLGYVTDTHGNEIDLDEHNGIDILGDIVESSHESVNKEFYGSLHNWGHVLMAAVEDPDGKFQCNPGVMDDTATSLRDPIFYRWHRFLDDLFQEFKSKFHPYNKKELEFPGVKIESVAIESKEHDVIHTFFAEDTIDVTYAYNFRRPAPVKVRLHHLDHEPFNYNIIATNQSANKKHAFVRIFLAPVHDELGNVLKPEELRRLMIELDKFSVELHHGSNTIKRSSKDSSVTISSVRSFRELLEGEGIKEHASEFCSCGWPDHLLIPKGNDQGMEFNLFVMVTDELRDRVGDYGHADICMDAVSYCGAKDQFYPDRRPMGFPFDRVIQEEEMGQWQLPNMSNTHIKIQHQHQHEKDGHD
uniref:Hemocyanin subunit c n=1 Tax=Mastigoproctus giganteus TaxID=58767 RepID=G8YZS0_MASGI|nr:hemocyanin subunit c [Mastigoproctus giganteus]